jgi:hypothetical protein
MEAVKWYSLAAELMPDSMHNLAKIYEDGRGGFEPDMTQAVTLYSVAAARGFPLSQVNLGRLFLLGEDGVTRDREAGKRLLTLAAESGDADAQMVVGMIHATPAFECYDLKLSEHWLRQSLAGGKVDAERLLVRVCQQMAAQQLATQQQQQATNTTCAEVTQLVSNLQDGGTAGGGGTGIASGTSSDIIVHVVDSSSSLPTIPLPLSQNAVAAKRRGDDFVYHGLLHAAVLEYSRAYELDRTKLSYFVDRLDALCILGHYEECLTDSSLLLLCVDADGFEYIPRRSMTGRRHGHGHGGGGRSSRSLSGETSDISRRGLNSSKKKDVDFFRAGLQSPEGMNVEDESMVERMKESQESMNRYPSLSLSLSLSFAVSPSLSFLILVCRLYDIIVESLGCLFSSPNFPLHDAFAFSRLTNRTATGMSSADTGGLLDSYNSLYDQTIASPFSELWPFSGSASAISADGSFGQNNPFFFELNEEQGHSENRHQYQQVAEDYMFNSHPHHREPMICRLLQDCMDWELKSTKSSAFLARSALSPSISLSLDLPAS